MDKLCPKCGDTKNLSEFYTTRLKPKGHAYCKKCQNEYFKQRWVQRKLDAIAYKGGVCLDCSRDYPYPVYEFHHLNPSDKDFDWTKLRLRSWSSITEELDKCVLLCANCHRLRHHNNN